MAASTRSRSAAAKASQARHKRLHRPVPPVSPSTSKQVRSPVARRKARVQNLRLTSPRLRLISVWVVLIVSMLSLGTRLAYLQLAIGDELKVMAQEQQAIQATPRASRRQMIDRQGNVVAMDRMMYTLYVHPVLFKESPEAIAEALSTVLDRQPQELSDLFAEQESGIKLNTDISEETAKRLRALRLDGLDLLPSPQRIYPQGELFSQVTGYVDLEGVPQEGLELSHQAQLKYDEPQPGEVTTPLQQVTRDGLQLQLTIDSRLQRIAQENLAKTVAEYRAKRGTLLIMDSRTGEILTLATAPSYDPNRYYDADIAYFKNWAVSDLYEPGSTFKPINVAIALENGSISASDTIYDEGQIFVGAWPIQNVDFSTRGGRGPLSITDVLRYSSNVGMVHVMETLSRDIYYNWLEKIGLGKPTGIDLPGEISGQLKERGQFVDGAIEAAVTSFGQGFSLTPLQLLQLHGILANDGKRVTPHVVRGLANAEGELTWTPNHPAPERVFSAETARQVLNMMKQVVDDGTGAAAKVAGYQIAGKTGTAQKATEYGAYGNQRITSFVSIAPVSDPRYVVLAVVDEPQGENAYGGTVAAPLVKKMLESLVVLEGIEPDTTTPTKATPTETAPD